MESYYIGTYDDCIELKKIIKSENGFSHLDRCLISTECSVADFEYSSPYPLLDSIEISKEDFLSLTNIVNILVSAAENKLYPILRSLKKEDFNSSMLKLGYHEENGYYSFGSRKGNEILIYGSIAVMQSADIKFEKEPVPFTYDEESATTL